MWVRDARRVLDLAGSLPNDRGLMPVDLWPSREDHGHRRIYWLSEQIDDLLRFSEVKRERQGWGSSA